MWKTLLLAGCLMISALMLGGCDEEQASLFFIERFGNYSSNLSSYYCPNNSYCSLVISDNVVYYNFTEMNGTIYWRMDT